MGRLDGQVTIVTGGASGIGLAIARRFAAEGATVVIADRTRDRGQDVAAELAATGAPVRFIATDVSDARAVEALITQTVDAYGRLDVLVNNAGIEVAEGPDGPAEEDWDRLFAINTRGVWLGCRFALPHLVRSKGAIVNTASVAALVGTANHAGYAASKAAVVSLTQSLALAYAEQGVRINAICPGPVLTPMTQVGWDAGGDESIRQTLALCPARRVAAPEEVAGLVVYLASPEAAFINGAAIPIDGGKSAGIMPIDRYRW